MQTELTATSKPHLQDNRSQPILVNPSLICGRLLTDCSIMQIQHAPDHVAHVPLPSQNVHLVVMVFVRLP